ncbi:M23/M56 family metallopeptidase [Pseudoduganella namucuonensis]|uniref:BlaR1 peptidase M56 n=1 Tax=Pseudoduganella namucuonensis TaxID=1035707 RepID=A0A1I7H8Z5_9BURK|nr:M23/M56 family metallopeptidase [Pseudoduganella namucuonensis]SFU57147.1 BlaR1 peptidase M56 [Pseudoduganella namucuonensis]
MAGYAIYVSYAAMALPLLQASATCIAAGAVAWAVLKLALRRWPGAASQRFVWLLAQCAVAATFVAVLLPGSGELSVVPAIEIAAEEGGAALSAMAGGGNLLPRLGSDPRGLTPGFAPVFGANEFPEVPAWLAIAALTWLACYAAGFARALWRWRKAAAAMRGLLASAEPLDAAGLRAHAGFAAQASLPAISVLETDAAISPMLVGLTRPLLLLPRHLRGFDALQQQLIVAHELTHWRRRDHWWLHASLLLQTVFWFNPAMRALGGQLSCAQELGCDRAVLASRPAAQRQSYAAALLAQLKLGMGEGACATAAFGGPGLAALGARIRLIRQSDLGRSGVVGVAGRAVLGAAALALLAASVLLQPAFAWRGVTRDALPATKSDITRDNPADAAPVAVWRSPLERPRVSSFYGPRPKPIDTAASFHHGLDFAARTGTPIRAPAPGKVAVSTDLYEGQAKWGKVIVIEHADGLRSLYAHLDQRAVRAGDTVQPGQVIGRTGATGRATGPHLHLEVQRNGEHIDPQRLIARLDDTALPSALRARASRASN